MAASKLAVAFFGIQGKKAADESTDQSKWAFTSGFSFHCLKAGATTKGAELQGKASELLDAHLETVPLSTRPSRGHAQDTTNFADVEATETTCALFQTLMNTTKIKAIEAALSTLPDQAAYSAARAPLLEQQRAPPLQSANAIPLSVSFLPTHSAARIALCVLCCLWHSLGRPKSRCRLHLLQ